MYKLLEHNTFKIIHMNLQTYETIYIYLPLDYKKERNLKWQVN
jgi:hypothetical protein